MGLAGAASLILFLAWRALRGSLQPVHALGLALLALVALSPMVQPWYLLWGTAVVAATSPHGRAGTAVAVLSAALVYETHPTGSTPPYGFALAAVAGVIGALLVRREPPEPEEARLPAPRGAEPEGAGDTSTAEHAVRTVPGHLRP
ncbi:hypothetical protein Sfulv_56970 [Streptomyces fulvorobeus]|uniref:Integral membrane protein n=1 Tax=Streptomyces fulvorobeus TaxID=284028 RepID=A0A7J0CGP1_9ACTN|nr:hypothetical protein Sfulv_56970 [Streptomyces fulvorobeus]